MGAWYFCRNDAETAKRLDAASVQLERHGFAAPRRFATATHSGLYAGHIHPNHAAYVEDGGDFVAIAGTLFYKGEAGEAALRRFLKEVELPFTAWDDVTGHFAALICKGGRLMVFNDYFGAFHVYQTEARDVVTTSLLAAAQSVPRLHFDPQSVYEFVFSATPLGDTTVLAEISKLPRTEQLELAETVTVHRVAKPLPQQFTPDAADVKQQADRLRGLFTAPLKAYGDQIQCPLSGGFDSRLVLAVLLDAGVKPHVYVYGGPNDADVQIARHIGKAEGFEVEVFNKGAYRKIEPDAFADIVAYNFHEMDGLPIDGGLFDNGGNSAARHDRARGGALAVSGAAGEIFRNYFYMRDRPWRTRDVLYAFYAGFNPADCTDLFDEAAFFDGMEAKLRQSLGVANGHLTRPQVESAYPLFRCPAFFGREISIVGRFGAYFMPFFEYAMVRETMGLPIDQRNHGRFQSQLLTEIHPRLAAYPSAYGHSFTEPAGFKHRLAEGISLYRPPWLRRYGYRMKAWAGKQAEQPSGLMAAPYLGKVIDLSFPAMSRFFQMDRLKDGRMYRRIATLEYFAAQMGSRLSLS